MIREATGTGTPYRRALDLLAGWAQYVDSCIGDARTQEERTAYECERDAIRALYEDLGSKSGPYDDLASASAFATGSLVTIEIIVSAPRARATAASALSHRSKSRLRFVFSRWRRWKRAAGHERPAPRLLQRMLALEELPRRVHLRVASAQGAADYFSEEGPMSNCYTAGDGATHHAGCACHEDAHRADVERLRNALADLVEYTAGPQDGAFIVVRQRAIEALRPTAAKKDPGLP